MYIYPCIVIFEQHDFGELSGLDPICWIMDRAKNMVTNRQI